MMFFDRRVILYLILTAGCICAMCYQLHAVASGAGALESQKKGFLSSRNAAFKVVEDTTFLEANYSQLQKLVDDQKIRVRQHVGQIGDQANALQARVTADSKSSELNSYQNPQRKVSWIKTLQSAKTNVGVAEMSFEIYPIQSIAGNLQDLQVAVGFESVVLQVSMLHDGLLATLIAYLEEHAPNPFTVTALSIERVGESADSKIAARINAEITIKWYVIEIEGVPS